MAKVGIGWNLILGKVPGTALALNFTKNIVELRRWRCCSFIYAVSDAAAREDIRMGHVPVLRKPRELVGRWEMREDGGFGEEVPSDDELHPKARWHLAAT